MHVLVVKRRTAVISPPESSYFSLEVVDLRQRKVAFLTSASGTGQKHEPGGLSIAPTVRAANPPVRAANPPVRAANPPVRAANPPVRAVNPPVRAANPPVRAANPP
eukprot:7412672-Pyramimonas_sp.AAC.1